MNSKRKKKEGGGCRSLSRGGGKGGERETTSREGRCSPLREREGEIKHKGGPLFDAVERPKRREMRSV